MLFDFSNITLLPVLIASITSLVAEIAWVRLYQKKGTIPSFAIQFCLFFLFTCVINLVYHHNHHNHNNHLISNIKESLYMCVLFVGPALGLQALNNQQSFSNWFKTTLYITFHTILLSSVNFGVIKLMS